MGNHPIAVADLGSNTLHLLIARVEDGRVREVVDESEMLQLGADVDSQGAISETKVAAAIDVLQRFKRRSACTGADTLHLMATQAVRAARNRDAFIERIEAAIGVPVKLLTVEDEARLAFDGVTLCAQSLDGGVNGFSRPFLLIDVGGGSTQLAIGHAHRLLQVQSIPLGSGKLTTQCLPSDPPTRAELERVEERVRAELAALDETFGVEIRPESAFGVGGSAKAVRRLANLPRAGQPIEVQRLGQMRESLCRLNATATANAFGITRRRARTLPAGIVVLEQVLRRFELPSIRIKQSGIRDGAVLRIARTGHL